MSGYTVKPGDSLSSVARRLGVSTTQLLKANPSLVNSSGRLQIGQSVNLPSQSSLGSVFNLIGQAMNDPLSQLGNQAKPKPKPTKAKGKGTAAVKKQATPATKQQSAAATPQAKSNFQDIWNAIDQVQSSNFQDVWSGIDAVTSPSPAPTPAPDPIDWGNITIPGSPPSPPTPTPAPTPAPILDIDLSDVDTGLEDDLSIGLPAPTPAPIVDTSPITTTPVGTTPGTVIPEGNYAGAIDDLLVDPAYAAFMNQYNLTLTDINEVRARQGGLLKESLIRSLGELIDDTADPYDVSAARTGGALGVAEDRALRDSLNVYGGRGMAFGGGVKRAAADIATTYDLEEENIWGDIFGQKEALDVAQEQAITQLEFDKLAEEEAARQRIAQEDIYARYA